MRYDKGGKQRIVRIGATSQKALWRYLTVYRRGKSDRVFLTRSGDSLEGEGIEVMVRAAGKRAGIPDVHVHRLRHTFAVQFLRCGGDIFTLRYMLGHSSLGMVQRYLGSLNADDAARAHQKCSPVDNLQLKKKTNR